MKKLTAYLASGILLLGIVGCDNSAKTSASAPNSTDANGQLLNREGAQANQDDAQNDVRKNQLNADIRAREQRNDIAGNQNNRTDGDLESEVRSKLEANIPGGQLTVSSKDGAVVIAGYVSTQDELSKVEPLAKQILGVKSVLVSAKVSQ